MRHLAKRRSGLICAVLVVCVGRVFGAGIDVAGFDANVKPILKNTCAGCHNATLTSGGVNLVPYLDATTLSDDRSSWERILQKVEPRLRASCANPSLPAFSHR